MMFYRRNTMFRRFGCMILTFALLLTGCNAGAGYISESAMEGEELDIPPDSPFGQALAKLVVMITS